MKRIAAAPQMPTAAAKRSCKEIREKRYCERKIPAAKEKAEAEAAAAKAKEVFGDMEEVKANVAGEFAFVTKKMSEAAFEEKLGIDRIEAVVEGHFLDVDIAAQDLTISCTYTDGTVKHRLRAGRGIDPQIFQTVLVAAGIIDLLGTDTHGVFRAFTPAQRPR